MDRLSRVEIEQALGFLLPECKVECKLSADGSASLMVSGPSGEAFAVMSLIRSDYHGEAGLKRLASQIFDEIQLARVRPLHSFAAQA